MATTTTTTSTTTEHPPPALVSDEKELESYGVVRIKLPDWFDCAKFAAELSTVTPEIMAGQGDGEYAFYRNIMEEADFPFASLLLDSDIGKTLLRYFPIQSLTELRLDDAFCVHYNYMTQDDTSGARHVDPSDMTVNMCLEKTNDVEESDVLFYGTQELEGVADVAVAVNKNNKKHDEHNSFLVEQIPGYATVHWGHHPHQTMAMKAGGRRTNIILTYCYVDSTRSDVASRSCYA